MPDQNSHQGRRPHVHRGRRGPDRRGPERRTISHASEQGGREQGGRDHVDVEQIMRDIRARIVQRHGIELSNQQIQELAARRLEAILEPRNIKPALLEQLRKNAAEPPDYPAVSQDPGYTFEDTTLYETHRGVLRFFRKLLNPILKLFFNPTPLVHALNTQARLNKEAAAREAERDRRQAEWNALHYEVLQRAVTEVSRVSIEMQAISNRIESLSAKVDFNDRRVRSLENTAPQGRPQPNRPTAIDTTAPAAPSRNPETALVALPDAAPNETPGDAPRKRRRRRRGRRGGAGAADAQAGADALLIGADAESGDDGDLGDVAEGPEGGDSGDDEAPQSLAAVAAPREANAPPTETTAVAFEPAHTISPLQPLEPHATPPPEPDVPRDEPSPAAPADHADPGPPDR